MSDYAGLKAEIASSSDPVWYAVNAVLDFLRKLADHRVAPNCWSYRDRYADDDSRYRF